MNSCCSYKDENGESKPRSCSLIVSQVLSIVAFIFSFFISLRFLMISSMFFVLKQIAWFQPRNATLLVVVSLVCILAGFFSFLLIFMELGSSDEDDYDYLYYYYYDDYYYDYDYDYSNAYLREFSACFVDCDNERTSLGVFVAVLLLLSGFLPLPFACKQCGKESKAAAAAAATTTTAATTTATVVETSTSMSIQPAATATTPFDTEAGVVEITTRPTDARAGAAERAAVATIVAMDPEPPTVSAAPTSPTVAFAKAEVIP